MIVDVSSAVAVLAAGAVGGSAVWGAWLLFRNGGALWNKLGEVAPDSKLDAWNDWASSLPARGGGGGGGSGGGSTSSGGATVESWGFSDVLSSGGGSSGASSEESARDDSFSGGGGEFGGGGSESDF